MNIDDWVIVIAHGKSFIGREVPVDTARDILGVDPATLKPTVIGHTWTKEPGLSPVYELVTGMQMVQRSPREPPQMMTVRQCLPVLTFASVRSIAVAGIRIPVASLSADEQKAIAQSVDGCEQLMVAMRAAESGIVLAPPGSRVKDGGR